MAVAYDTLGHAKRLTDAGIDLRHAEAHAEAARDFIMAELVTKTDLAAAVSAIETKMSALETKIEAKIEMQTLRMTVRLGSLVLAALGALTIIQRLL
jgi:predicted  nucleic acid-binding Zn-ribbon protein